MLRPHPSVLEQLRQLMLRAPDPAAGYAAQRRWLKSLGTERKNTYLLTKKEQSELMRQANQIDSS